LFYAQKFSNGGIKMKDGIDDKGKKEKDEKNMQFDRQEGDIFSTQEIQIEELAIDGVCGVY
jgi:mycofactocin precursor